MNNNGNLNNGMGNVSNSISNNLNNNAVNTGANTGVNNSAVGTGVKAKKNVKISNLSKLMKSKSFVTAICAIIAVVVLIVGYNVRVNNAVKPVSVPVAAKRLGPKHLITEADIKYINIPSSAISSDYYARKEYIVGKYVNYDTTIPAGSMFYGSSIITKSELPDEALSELKEGESLYYLTVNMLTTFSNSILPGRYIDIMISTKENGKALVGRIFKNVKVLQVKTADGQNVFDSSSSTRVPYVLIFALPEEQHMLLRDINAINNYSIASSNSNFSRIEVIPIPTSNYYETGDEEITSTVSSQYLKEFILDKVAEIPEEIEVPTIE